MNDNAITKVVLNGFKGIFGTYEIDGATALEGPMGAGKSACLEAIRFALRGDVPPGKKADIIATYFPPDGGQVTIWDRAGRWIRRGVSVDRKRSKKVSTILETSETEDGAKEAEMASWAATPIVLDIGDFIGLSAEKRRQFILKICGSSEVVTQGLLDSIGTIYAKDIGGKAAKLELLSDESSWSDFTEPEVDLLKAYYGNDKGRQSIFDILHAELIGGGSISEASAKLIDRASRELSANRAIAKEARAAAGELESTAIEARVIADGGDSISRRLSVARDVHAASLELKSKIESADASIVAAKAAKVDSTRRLIEAEAKLALLDPPGNEPKPVSSSIDIPMEALSEARKYLRISESRLLEMESLSKTAKSLSEVVSVNSEAVKSHEASVIGVLVKDWERVYSHHLDERDKEGAALLQAMDSSVEAASKEWIKNEELLSKRLEDSRKAASRALEELSAYTLEHGSLSELERYKSAALSNESELRAKIDKLQAEAKKELSEYKKLKGAYDARVDAYAETAKVIASASGALSEAERGIEASIRARQELGDDVPDLAISLMEIEKLEALDRDCGEARGAVKAFDAATEKARRGEVLELAWSKVSSAIRSAREELISQATMPVKDDIDSLLPDGVECFLDLEDERGSPVFHVGITINGSRIAIGPMSDGWSTIFLSALVVAIARRTKGRKVLSIEGDHLDEDGLRTAMTSLAPIASELDALLIATSREIPSVPGWTLFDVNGGVQTRRVV